MEIFFFKANLIHLLHIEILFWKFLYFKPIHFIISSHSKMFPVYFINLLTVHSEGDQPWDFFGRNDAKAETPVLWPPHEKSWLSGKDSDAGRDWGQEEKGMAEDEMAGWHHWLDGHKFEWTLGVGDGQGGLVCCNSWGHKESDTTEQLNWTEHRDDSVDKITWQRL